MFIPLFLFLLGLAIGAAALGIDWQFIEAADMSRKTVQVGFIEFSGIALMAATVAVAALTLVTAVAGMFGFGFIRSEAAAKAVVAAEKRVNEIAAESFDKKLDDVLETARLDGTLADAIARALQGPDYTADADADVDVDAGTDAKAE